jgi:hypothetical protein
MSPWIFVEALTDRLGTIGAHHQKNVGRAVQGAAKNHHPFRHKPLHQFRVLLPVFLAFQADARQPSRTPRANHSK